MTARRGFTLMEVLVALLFLAIVLPAIGEGVSLATRAAADSQRRTQAAALGQSELSQMIASEGWENGMAMSGDFSPNFPDYHWSAAVVAWPGDVTGVGMQELELTVSWTVRGKDESMILSTLVYQREVSQ